MKNQYLHWEFSLVVIEVLLLVWLVIQEKPLCLSELETCPNAAAVAWGGGDINLLCRQEEGRFICKSIRLEESLDDLGQVTWAYEFLFPLS